MANQRSTTRNQSGTSQGKDGAQTLSVKEALNELMNVEGAVGAALVDYENGMTLGTVGGRDLDMELAGSGTTEVVRSERNIIHDLGREQGIEDILISLSGQFHLIRMCERHEDVFIYLVINRNQGNLGLARREIDEIDKKLELT